MEPLDRAVVALLVLIAWVMVARAGRRESDGKE